MMFAMKGSWEGDGGGGGGRHTDVTERQSPQRSWGCLRRSQGGIPIPKPVLGLLTPMTSAWGPSQAVPVLRRLGQGVPVCGMGIQTPHGVKADPSPRGSSAGHWDWSLKFGCSWHFPVVLQELSAPPSHILLFPLIFMQHSWPPIFQSPPNGVGAVLTLCKTNHLFTKLFFFFSHCQD